MGILGCRGEKLNFKYVHLSVCCTAVKIIFFFSAVLGSLGKARVNSLIRTGASHPFRLKHKPSIIFSVVLGHEVLGP